MKQQKQTKIFEEPKEASFGIIKKQIDEMSIDNTAKLGLRWGLVLLGLTMIIVAVKWQALPPEVPLLYSRAYGEEQLVKSGWVWMLPGLMLILELISIKMAAKIWKEDKLMAEMIIWIGVIMTAMGLIALVKIVFLVT